jgi:hypothetical protein
MYVSRNLGRDHPLYPLRTTKGVLQHHKLYHSFELLTFVVSSIPLATGERHVPYLPLRVPREEL